MDAASIASSMVQAQAAMTAQKLAISTQKMAIEAQQSVADLITTASAPSSSSANSAITGRGQVLDISV